MSLAQTVNPGPRESIPHPPVKPAARDGVNNTLYLQFTDDLAGHRAQCAMCDRAIKRIELPNREPDTSINPLLCTTGRRLWTRFLNYRDLCRNQPIIK